MAKMVLKRKKMGTMILSPKKKATLRAKRKATVPANKVGCTA